MSIFKRIYSKIGYYKNYVIANTFLRREVDADNNCFNIMPDEELIDRLINGYGFSRFGDGELSLIYDDSFALSFQEKNCQLNKKLKEVLESNLDNLIVGISIGFSDPGRYSKKIQRYYRTFNFIYRREYKKIIPRDKIYGNASITRFYIDYDEKGRKKAMNRLHDIQRIWNNKNVLIVEGLYTRVGVGNGLLRNAKNVRRILVPSVDAFNKYDVILKSVLDNVKDNELVLAAIGPTATVLAYDLAKREIQCIDIGHIDVEYEWMKMGTKKRVLIPGKYVNEVRGKKIVDDNCIDKEYQSSIIEEITKNEDVE